MLYAFHHPWGIKIICSSTFKFSYYIYKTENFYFLTPNNEMTQNERSEVKTFWCKQFKSFQVLTIQHLLSYGWNTNISINITQKRIMFYKILKYSITRFWEHYRYSDIRYCNRPNYKAIAMVNVTLPL